MTNLLVISTAPVSVSEAGLILDNKFVEGMSYYSENWIGTVSCLILNNGDNVSFGRLYEISSLPFSVIVKEYTDALSIKDIAGYDVILASGDDHSQLKLSDYCIKNNKYIVFSIENTVKARREMLFLDNSRGFIKRAYSLIWMVKQEFLRQRAFRQADGIQINGYPAYDAYGSTNFNVIKYLDNRISKMLLATPEEMAARGRRLTSGKRLNLMHSGRLEPLKGSQDLIPIAHKLMHDGIDFQLNIFGSGSLEGSIKRGIIDYGLQGRVFLHGAVDFENELVPYARLNADIYLSCHRQSDPSCTYLESMGCGLAVIGYANSMWASLCHDSQGGWSVALGNVKAFCDAIILASNDRPELIRRCFAARAFAGDHTFEKEFQRRIEHLRLIASNRRES